MSIINIDNFFNFNENAPINRIAYSEEDAKYKLKCMKGMQDLGMQISIDDAGNICGTLPGNFSKNQTLVIGSHTDSVKDGGQFDGPIGVYMALKAIENFKNTSKSKQYGNIKNVIYACEESTRFSKACLGSYYLSGEISYEELCKLKDKNGIPFANIIADYKDYLFSHFAEYGIDLNNVQLVDKILDQSEIAEALESHIEQAEVLTDTGISIGGVDSIGKPLRGDISVHGKNSIVTASKIINSFDKLANSSKQDSTEENLRVTFPKFDSSPNEENAKTITSQNGSLIKIDARGEHNHSGSTPPAKRKDAVLGLAKLILELDELQKSTSIVDFNFLGLSTPSWGANQIQDNASLIMQVNNPELIRIIEEKSKKVQDTSNITFDINNIESAEIQADSETQLFVDVRQQYPATGKNTREKLYNSLKEIQENIDCGEDSISFRITAMGDPIQTNTELLENIKAICDKKNYPCQLMHSWPGHDLACVLAPTNKTGKRVLFFIPSTGGSHNPEESTTKKDIEIGTDVYSSLVSSRMHNFEKQYENQREI